MLRQKLYDIKLILRIVISLFVVVSMVKGCSKAFTYSEFYDFIEETNANNEQPASMTSNLNFFLRSDVQNFITTKQNLKAMFPNLETSNNLSFIITKPSNDSLTFDLYMYEFEDCDCTIALDTSYQNIPKCNMTNMVNCLYAAKIKVYLYNGQIGTNEVLNLKTSSNMTQHWVRNANMTGLIQSTNFTNNTSLLFTNNYSQFEPLAFSHMFSQDLNYQNTTIQAFFYNYRNSTTLIESLINKDSYTSLDISLSFSSGDSFASCSFDLSKSSQAGDISIVNINDYATLSLSSRLIYKNTLMLLKVDGFSGDSLVTSISEYIVGFPQGTTITNGSISGDIPTDDYTIQDNSNNIIGFLGSGPSGDDNLGTGLIGNILKGIKNLFVPDSAYLSAYFSDLNDFFSAKLGILYFPIDFLLGLLDRIVHIDFSNPTMTLGPYIMPLNDNFELVPQITIDFNSFIQDETMYNVHQTYLVIVDGLLCIALINSLRKTYTNIIKNRGA